MDGEPIRPSDTSTDTARRAASDAAAANDAPGAMTAGERDTVEKTSAPLGAVAGAAAGAAAGLSSYVFGPIAAPIGAVLGALAGGAGGWFAGQEAKHTAYDGSDDAHYRALYEGTPEYTANRGFDVVRPAFQFGHVAAYNPEYQGREFEAIEPELQRAWSSGDFAAQYGDWSTARHHARDAYGHARSSGAGVRRDTRVIGSAGSAVDPVELDRARSGLASVDSAAEGGAAEGGAITYDHAGYANTAAAPGAPATRTAAPRDARDGDRQNTGGLGERPEVDADTAHRRDSELF